MLVANKHKVHELAENLDGTQMAKGRSLWKDAWHRFVQNKMAIVCLFILAAVITFSFVAPFFAYYSNEKIDWSILGQIAQKGQPSFETGHYFGADNLGRDLFARIAQGTQISLMVGVIGASVAVVIGTLYGATAGYIGGRTDQIMMRIVDVLMAIPFMFVLILMLVVFGRSISMLFIGIGMLSWLDMSRIVRGQTLSIKNKEFVEAAQATGVSDFNIIVRHIVPNLLGVVAVYATLLVPGMIMAESFISFLGLGVQEPSTSWGALIKEGSSTIGYGTPWQLAFPMAFFAVTLLSFYFIGDGLRDALDPKDR